MAPSSPGRAPIARLARRTASLVRSAVVVPSLQSILAELVHNSLDANTRSVHCSVDLDTWTIRCDDSGYGIPHSDLQLLARSSTGGDSCRSHLTSKHAPGDDGPASYGFRGEALASIRDLATLDILTRPLAARDDGAQTWHCVLRGERCLAFEQAQVDRTTPGTTVTVRDIFHKVRCAPLPRFRLSSPTFKLALMSGRSCAAPRTPPLASQTRRASRPPRLSALDPRLARAPPPTRRLLPHLDHHVPLVLVLWAPHAPQRRAQHRWPRREVAPAVGPCRRREGVDV